MKLMNKLSALMLVFTVIASGFTGCSSTQNASSSGDGSASDSESASGESVTLTMWIWDEAQAPATQDMIDAFEEDNPGITVELTTIAGTSDYFTKLQTVIGTSDAPSVFWLNMATSKDYIALGVVQDLTDLIEESGYDISIMNEKITEIYTVDGRYYGIPKDQDSYAVFYNKQLFDNKGLEYPQEDWTFDDFFTYCEQLSGDGVVGWTNSTSDRVYGGFIFSEGGSVLSEDGTESLVNSGEATGLMQKFMDCMNNGYALNGTQLNEMSSSVAFESNLAAMTIEGSWMVAEYAAALGDNLGIIDLPSGSAGKSSVNSGIGYCTSVDNPYLEESWKFIQYLGSKEAQDMEVSVVIPACNESASVWESTYPDLNLSAFTNALSYDLTQLVPMAATNADATRTAFQSAIGNMLAGQYADAQEFLDDAKAKMDAAIANG